MKIKKILSFLLLFAFINNYSQTRIIMNKENGVYTVPCIINGLPLKFIFDTGASDVSISLTEAMFMLKNGYLKKEDIGEEIYYSIANGDVAKGTRINIREVEFGGLKLYNISASIVHETSAPLLLGQSVIEKLGIIQINGTELTILNNENISYVNTNSKKITTYNDANKQIRDDKDEFLFMKYQRLQKEINASHILVALSENSTKTEELAAYNKILTARNRILNGEKFESVALEISDDNTVKENLGNLGFFSAFKMVPQFEDVAYQTSLYEISMPVKTRFGYHIIKVNEIRKNKGQVLVSHIMILNQNPDSKKIIEDIYKKIQSGENFEDLAKQYSEDKSTAESGGILKKFSSGELTSEEFESRAFSLENIGSTTEPFQTSFGWHIIKLLDRFPIKSFEELKIEIEEKNRNQFKNY